MMMIKRKAILITVALFLISLAATAQQVKTDYDRHVNFNQYKTFSFAKIQTSDPLMVDRVKSAIRTALADKGMTEVESGGDISINATEMTSNQQALNTSYDNFGFGRRFGAFGNATTTTENYQVGTLVVDILDTNSKALVWRGSASDTLSNKSDQNIKDLHKGVDKMFKHFPPKAK